MWVSYELDKQAEPTTIEYDNEFGIEIVTVTLRRLSNTAITMLCNHIYHFHNTLNDA